MVRLLRDVLRLVRSWWRSDRIRIGPAEGRLLRLQPGALVSIRGQLVKLVQRREWFEEGGARVEYLCEGEDGEVAISAGGGSERGVQVRCRLMEASVFVPAEDVCVLRESGSASTTPARG